VWGSPCDVRLEAIMYTVTFYSFKGGVGRTLALVNVAVALANMGRRVLIVDFDLEAPGLDSFNLPKPENPTDGIVEYISAYLKSGTPPNVDDYIYKCAGIGAADGGLWVMPSGNPEKQYAWNLSQINWQDLYEHHDGFLLLENLKQQWREVVAPDYVLIDSRTGHTDVEGICTRQLPDALVAMFFPNQQNLRGMRRVIKDIRLEDRAIRLHFVVSNVPDLDDEAGILAGQMREFKEALGYGSLSATIHHYSNLALVRQAIFTAEFPSSRLAQEYRRLTQSIIQENAEDRDAVLGFLDRIPQQTRRIRFQGSPDELENKIKVIHRAHSTDGEILFRLALVERSMGRWDDALKLLDDALTAGYRTPDVLLERAESRDMCGDAEGTTEDILSLLENAEVPAARISYALHLLRRANPRALTLVGGSAAIANLENHAKIRIARDLAWAQEGLSSAIMILTKIMADKMTSKEDELHARGHLITDLIGAGEFARAIAEIGQLRPIQEGEERSVADYYNFAMAEWALTGVLPKDFLRCVLELENRHPADNTSANRLQCFAIAYWGLGKDTEAENRLQLAKQKLMERATAEFSCWRYLMTPPREFLGDLILLSRMIKGERIVPAFLKRI
jgi:MinD-like ATPase involved in chromosome partitioning or flagellar assembly